jgi:mitochondrial enoyl-[acyl-carrier protein] reductase / trans-2-enoyl-CoA reductase
MSHIFQSKLYQSSPTLTSTFSRSFLKCKSRSALKPQTQYRQISVYGYTQAKSLVFSKTGTPNEVLSLHTHSLSAPHNNLITLRTLAAPLNPADINQIQGTYAAKATMHTTLGTAQPSAVPGNEGVFEVLATGSNVTGIEKGDWVIPRRTGLGTWRTHLQTEHNNVIRVDKTNLRPIDAATVTVNPLTAWRMLTDFETLTPGKDWFIQNGANSAVGRAALQLAKKWSIPNIAVIRQRPGEGSEPLRKELLALGATKVVTDHELTLPDFKERVHSWTAQSGVSGAALRLALNCVGGKPAADMAKVIAPNGCMVTYGAMSHKPLNVSAGLQIFKNIRFQGFWVSRWGDANPEEKEKCIGEVLDLIRKGEFQTGPTEEVPWEWKTDRESLVNAVARTLDGYRKGKGVFVFGET